MTAGLDAMAEQLLFAAAQALLMPVQPTSTDSSLKAA